MVWVTGRILKMIPPLDSVKRYNTTCASVNSLTVYVKLIEDLFYSEAYDLFHYVYNM